jgi:hypothetical protein
LREVGAGTRRYDVVHGGDHAGRCWPVEQATKPAKLETSIVLELEADGSLIVA